MANLLLYFSYVRVVYNPAYSDARCGPSGCQ